MENIKEKIHSLISEIHNMHGKGQKATVKPILNIVSDKEKYLDTLARLMTGEETCVAVHYDKHNKKLFVASNREEAYYAKKYLDSLTYFANSPTQGNYSRLVKLASEQVFSKRVNRSALDSLQNAQQSLKNRGVCLDNFKKEMESCRNLKKINEEVIIRIQKSAQELFEELNWLKKNGKNSLANVLWDYLSLLEDTNIITNVLFKKELDEGIREAIMKPKLREYISGAENVHAEMKIVGRIYKTGSQTLRDNPPQYIGITKLACATCQLIVEIINKNDYGSFFNIYGTHGSIYPKWKFSDDFSLSLQEKLLEKLESLKNEETNATKLRESTSEIPDKLSISIFCICKENSNDRVADSNLLLESKSKELKQSKEEVLQLRKELEQEKVKNIELQNQLQTLQNKYNSCINFSKQYLQSQKSELSQLEKQLNSLQIEEAQIEIPPKGNS